MSVNLNMVTTTFDLPGYRVVRTIGLVRGVTVRSRSIFGTLGASLQTVVGGNITLFEEMCEKTREQALELMVTHAMQQGANAVVGVRYDATEVMQGVTEVLATAPRSSSSGPHNNPIASQMASDIGESQITSNLCPLLSLLL